MNEMGRERPDIKNYVMYPKDSGCYVTHNNISYAEALEKHIDYLESELKTHEDLHDVRLSFDELTKEILKFNAKSEYQQASIVILRKIFEAHEA